MTRVCIGEGHTNKQEHKMTTAQKIAAIKFRMNTATMGCETIHEINRIEAPFWAEIRLLASPSGGLIKSQSK